MIAVDGWWLIRWSTCSSREELYKCIGSLAQPGETAVIVLRYGRLYVGLCLTSTHGSQIFHSRALRSNFWLWKSQKWIHVQNVYWMRLTLDCVIFCSHFFVKHISVRNIVKQCLGQTLSVGCMQKVSEKSEIKALTQNIWSEIWMVSCEGRPERNQK